jgi:hypothetical protein
MVTRLCPPTIGRWHNDLEISHEPCCNTPRRDRSKCLDVEEFFLHRSAVKIHSLIDFLRLPPSTPLSPVLIKMHCSQYACQLIRSRKILLTGLHYLYLLQVLRWLASCRSNASKFLLLSTYSHSHGYLALFSFSSSTFSFEFH